MGLGTTLKISFDAKKVQSGLSSISSKIASIGKKFATFGLAAITTGFAAITAGLLAFTVSASGAASEIEGMKTAFTVLTGSAEKANKVLEEIREFGATTPLEQKDLQQSAQTLLAFGVSLADVMPTLKMLGDISMGNAEKLGSLALVFGQVSSAGKLTGGDLLQFINVGFNPLNEIAKRTGKSMGELRDMMSKGQITTRMVKQAFEDATGAGGMFNGMLAKMADTTEGKMSNMWDSIAGLKVAFGTGINEGLKVALDAINTKLPEMLDKFKTFGESIGQTISDAVNGNFQKLADIGQLIGDVISAAATAAYQAGSINLVEEWANGVKKVHQNMWTPGGTILNDIAGRVDKGPSFGELFDAQLVTRGVQRQFQQVTGANPQEYKPSPQSQSFQQTSSEVLARTMDRLTKASEETARNTAGGAKM